MSASILVVEDDVTTRTTIMAVLERSGYRVTAAPDGETALELLDNVLRGGPGYDVIVTDIRMGAVDGIEVVYAARNQPQPPAIIILTGQGTMDTAIAALRAGAQDYLTKPCKPADLLEYVAAAVQRHLTERRQVEALQTITDLIEHFHDGAALPASAADAPPEGAAPAPPSAAAPVPPSAISTLQVGPLCIDNARHIITIDSDEIHTTPMEYALLHCLAQAHGHVVTYEEVVRRTHGYAIDKRDAHALLKPHVRNIRNKLPPGLLITVRGVGYRLVDPQH